MPQEIHLRDIFRIFRKHRWTLAISLFAIMGSAVLLNQMTTPLYEAKSKVIIERSDPNTLAERSAFTERDPEFFETQYQIIKSKAVAARVIEILGKQDPATIETLLGEKKERDSMWPEWLRSLGEKIGLAADPTDATEVTEDPRVAMVQAMSKDIRVRPLDNSHLVQISYLSKDPRFAALVVNTVVQAYIDEITMMKTDNSRSSVAWMTGKAEMQERKLKEAEAALQRYMGENEILSLENRVAVIPEKLSRISSELVTAEARRQEMETLSQKVSRLGVDPDAAESMAAVLSDQALQTLRGQIVEAEKNILELSGKYGPRHPAMQKARGDLNILRRKKEQEIARIIRSIRNQYELAALNERNLKAQFEASKEEALRMNEKFLRYQSLKAEVDNNRQLLDALVMQAKQEGITGERQGVKAWTVESASVPRSPSTPKKMLNLSMGLLLGLLAGAGLALFREYLDGSIKDPDGAESALQVPVLGTISLCRRERIEQIVIDDPLSAFAEGYKSLRTMILAGSDKSRRLLVTSSLPGEGKTSTAVNLALGACPSRKKGSADRCRPAQAAYPRCFPSAESAWAEPSPCRERKGSRRRLSTGAAADPDGDDLRTDSSQPFGAAAVRPDARVAAPAGG